MVPFSFLRSVMSMTFFRLLHPFITSAFWHTLMVSISRALKWWRKVA
ncbi:Uncharacterised protein [Segatella copri]|nr:Uncharacterised protein [Segatella copri]